MKRLGLIGLVLICLMIAVSMILPVSAAGSYLRGDADGDGHVTIMDATVIQRRLAEIRRCGRRRTEHHRRDMDSAVSGGV